jgi:protein SCO1/2/putative membrane protein
MFARVSASTPSVASGVPTGDRGNKGVRFMLRFRTLWVAVPLLCVSCSPPNERLYRDLGAVPPFQLTERSGKTITRDDLKGKIWIAHFFFTCCTQGCPETTRSMKDLQDAFARDDEVRLVSISVWPENDTPEMLQKYAADRDADAERWLFLTGPEEEVYRLVQQGFFQSIEKHADKEPATRVTHTFRLVVVDQRGQIVGYIDDGRDPAQVAQLESRVRALMPLKRFLPAMNAVLNGTCTVLLIAGYLAIRRRKETLHKVCMLLALAVSIVFLASYLYYHFVVLDGKPTGFQGQGWIRPVYFAVLLSHTLLAMVVAPLALYTVFVGLRDRRPRHVKVGRWTLPLWLYVSVTGVIVYWMLYHLPAAFGPR